MGNVAPRRLGRLQGAEAVEACALEDTPDGGAGEAKGVGDTLHAPALAPQRGDLP